MKTSASIFDWSGLTFCTGRVEDEHIGNHVWGDVSGANADFTERKTVCMEAAPTTQRFYILNYGPNVNNTLILCRKFTLFHTIY